MSTATRAIRMLQSSPARVGAGCFAPGQSYLAYGDGPPLVMFRGLTPSSANPTGVARWSEQRFLAPLARHFTVYAVNNRPGLAQGITMADLAADHAAAVHAAFGTAVDLFGISTGGAIAQQAAADHPNLVRRLILVATAYRLGSIGRAVQHRYAELLALGHEREAARALAPGLVDSRLSQWLVGGLLWLTAPLARAANPADMVAVLRAEDAFDLGERLSAIAAPTLVIGGDRDRIYPPELVAQIAERIPQANLIIYQGRGHRDVLTEKRLMRDVIAFLTADLRATDEPRSHP